MIFGNNDTHHQSQIVLGSDIKLAITIDKIPSTELLKCFRGAIASAGGKCINIPAEQVQPSSDDTGVFLHDAESLGITFSSVGLGYGKLEIEATFEFPDRDFPDDKKTEIFRNSPGIKLI